MEKRKLYELTKRFKTMRWKINTLAKNKTRCAIVPYIDARDIQDRLDRILGPENWYDHYEAVGTATYCTLYINVDGVWIGKSDCGLTISHDDDKDKDKDKAMTDKGTASDAFKRAAVKWGIGRYLYKLPLMWLDYDSRAKRPAMDGATIWDLDQYGNDNYNKEHRKLMTEIYDDLKKDFADKLKKYNTFSDVVYAIYDNIGIDIDSVPSDYWSYKKDITSLFESQTKSSSKKNK